MSLFRVFIKPFDIGGEYLSDFIEITNDVVKMGSIQQQLDNSEYDLGIFRNGGFTITLRNSRAKFADVDNDMSIFKFRRTGAQVKVTWSLRNNDLICGFFNAGEEFLGEDKLIYEGLLSDVVSTSSADDQTVEFQIQGFESLFDVNDVPFSSIANGDLISDIIYDCLNQEQITDLLTLNVANILPKEDVTIDFVADLENKTVKEALQELLEISNSVLIIQDRIIYVKARTPSGLLKYKFYGQASDKGIENIIDIKKYRDGLNRTFNYVTWSDTSERARDLTSIGRYGILKKEIGSTLINPAMTVKIDQLLASLKTEFAFPKIEMDLETPINYETLDLFLLDKVNIDYPNVYTAADNNPIPRYGQAIYGQARYPYGQFSLTISDSLEFKILSKKIDTGKQTINFGLRRA